MKPEVALQRILTEHNKAAERFEPLISTHEGYAVLLEEVEELWELIKQNGTKSQLAAEAKQVGAMAMRFMTDLC